MKKGPSTELVEKQCQTPAKRSKANARRTSSDTMAWAQEATAKPQKQEINKFLSSKLEEVK